MTIPKPMVAINYDEQGNGRLVYRYKLTNGDYLDVDKYAVDQDKNPTARLKAEYLRHEIGLGGWF